MSEINVMDASAVLAFLNKEKGEDVVDAALGGARSWISTVNYCEVLSKLCEQAMPEQEACQTIDELGMVVIDFDLDLAIRAAALRPRTKGIGASLGDRVCLALADHALHADFTPTVYTSERSWSKLHWPFKIAVIRAGKTS